MSDKTQKQNTAAMGETKKEQPLRGGDIFLLGLLLLGATSVVALLQLSKSFSLAYGLAQVAAVFLMGMGALQAGERSKLFTAAGVVFLLDSLLRLALQGVGGLNFLGSGERVVWLEFGGILLAAALDIVGVCLYLGACSRLEAGRSVQEAAPKSYTLYGILFGLATLLATAVPGLMAMFLGNHRDAAMGGVAAVALVFFAVCLLVGSRVRRSFRN